MVSSKALSVYGAFSVQIDSGIMFDIFDPSLLIPDEALLGRIAISTIPSVNADFAVDGNIRSYKRLGELIIEDNSGFRIYREYLDDTNIKTNWFRIKDDLTTISEYNASVRDVHWLEGIEEQIEQTSVSNPYKIQLKNLETLTPNLTVIGTSVTGSTTNGAISGSVVSGLLTGSYNGNTFSGNIDSTPISGQLSVGVYDESYTDIEMNPHILNRKVIQEDLEKYDSCQYHDWFRLPIARFVGVRSLTPGSTFTLNLEYLMLGIVAN